MNLKEPIERSDIVHNINHVQDFLVENASRHLRGNAIVKIGTDMNFMDIEVNENDDVFQHPDIQREVFTLQKTAEMHTADYHMIEL